MGLVNLDLGNLTTALVQGGQGVSRLDIPSIPSPQVVLYTLHAVPHFCFIIQLTTGRNQFCYNAVCGGAGRGGAGRGGAADEKFAMRK